MLSASSGTKWCLLDPELTHYKSTLKLKYSEWKTPMLWLRIEASNPDFKWKPQAHTSEDQDHDSTLAQQATPLLQSQKDQNNSYKHKHKQGLSILCPHTLSSILFYLHPSKYNRLTLAPHHTITNATMASHTLVTPVSAKWKADPCSCPVREYKASPCRFFFPFKQSQSTV